MAASSAAISSGGNHEEESNRQNPRDWSKWKKWRIILCITALNFLDTLGSSASAPAVLALLKEFGGTSGGRIATTLIISIYVLGLAIGPVLVAPLSEMYGRLWLYHGCNALFIIFNIACALSRNLGMLITFRALTGCVSAAPPAMGAGTIADLMDVEDRNFASALWASGAIIGPSIGPILGGFITEGLGWRWVFWIIAIAGGAVAVPCIFFLRETNATVPAVGNPKGKPTTTSQGDQSLSSDQRAVKSSPSVKESLLRPLAMLFTHPVVFLFSVYSAVAVGYMYILLTTFADVYIERYHFTTALSGLTFLGMGMGAIAGQIIYAGLSERTVQLHVARGDYRPELRLQWMPIGSFALPLGLFWYGWCVEKHVHWMASIVGTFPCGVGMVIVMVAPIVYLIDVYTEYAASAVAATIILRAIFGAFLPLAAFPLYDNLGPGWGNSLLGFIALVLAPIPLLMYRNGYRLRGGYPARMPAEGT